MDEVQRIRGLITEKGGVGLCMFHLARFGYEFLQTFGHSPYGDIWVQIGDRKCGIEIKTTRKGREWHTPRKQVEKVDFYCLVSLANGTAYVMTSAKMAEILVDCRDIYPGVARVAVDKIPRECLDAWDILGPHPFPPQEETKRCRAIGTWVRSLEDGTQKTYRNPKFSPTSASDIRGLRKLPRMA